MAVRADLTAAIRAIRRNERHIPSTIGFLKAGHLIGDCLQTLFDQGLGRMESIHTVQHCEHGVENQIGERLSRWSCEH